MVRSRFAAQMELLNTELIVMGTLCENALEHVMQALQEDNDALNREIIILGKRTEEKEREVETVSYTTAGCFRSASDFRITQNDH